MSVPALTARSLAVASTSAFATTLLKGTAAARSAKLRDGVWRWYLDDFLSRREHPNAIIFVTARWSDADPAGRILENMEAGGEQWHVLNYPALDEHDNALAPELIPRKNN